jgi:hypothetical protein
MNIFNIFKKKKYVFDKNQIDPIYEKEYIIFLSKYDIKSIFFSKHQILNFYIHDKDKLLDELNNNNNSGKHKIYFYDNNIEANILYKKIKFSTRDLFVPLTIYSIKKMDFKIRTLCQIAEKLGAESIDIHYKNYYLQKNEVNMDLKAIDNGLEAGNKTVKKESDNLKISMNYSKNNQKYNMNLNKYSLSILIELENELFITKKDYEADIDLQFLVESRCNNFINDYNTNLTINRFNSYETDILLKAKDIGFKFDISSIKDETINISINIKFLNIYDNYTCITGDNITPSKNAFCVLCGFINEEKKIIENSTDKNKLSDSSVKKKIVSIYSKLANYFRTYFKYLSKNFITIQSRKTKYIFDKSVYDKYTNIMRNFTQDELNMLFYKLFDGVSDSYYKFKNIIKKIIFGIESHNDVHYSDIKEEKLVSKFNYLCYYYNNTEKTKKFIVDNLALFYSKIMFDFIPYTYKIEFFKTIFDGDNLLFYYSMGSLFTSEDRNANFIDPSKYFKDHDDEDIKKKYDFIVDYFETDSLSGHKALTCITTPRIAFLMGLGFETKLFVSQVQNVVSNCEEVLEVYLKYLISMQTDTNIEKSLKITYENIYKSINNRKEEVNDCFKEWFSQQDKFLNYIKKLVEELFNYEKIICDSKEEDELDENNEDNNELIQVFLYNIGILHKSINNEKADLMCLKDIGTKKYMMFSNRRILIDYISHNTIVIMNYLFNDLHMITSLFEKEGRNNCEVIKMNLYKKVYSIYNRTTTIITNIIVKYFEKKDKNITIENIEKAVYDFITKDLLLKNNKDYKVYFTYENIESIVNILEDEKKS